MKPSIPATSVALSFYTEDSVFEEEPHQSPLLIYFKVHESGRFIYINYVVFFKYNDNISATIALSCGFP